MDIKKTVQNHLVAISIWIIGVAFAFLNLYLASQLTPLVKDIDILATRVQANDLLDQKQEANKIDRQEFVQVVVRLDKISNRLDEVIGILLSK